VDSLQPTYWHWWVVAIVLLAVEMFVPGAFFLWMGFSAAAVGALLLLVPAMGFKVQLGVFAVLSIVVVAVARVYLRRRPLTTDEPTLNRRGAQYVGRVLTLNEGIVNGIGSVRLDDSTWRVRGPDAPAGTTVEIVEADGPVLTVRPRPH
jgi:membrane protein implicated in regulation of membrane protease activity